MDRRSFLKYGAGFLAAASLPALSGCKPAQALKVGINPWPGFGFISVAAENGWIDPKQVMIERFPTYSDSGKALLEKRIDAAGLTLDEVVSLRQKGIDLSIVAILDVSLGADALLANPSLKTPADLKGKRIGVEESFLGRLMLQSALKTARLQAADVEVVGLKIDHVKAWKTLGLDAIITYEPSISQLEEQGLVRLFDSKQIPDTIIDVLVVRAELAEQNPDALRALLQGHFRGLNAWKGSNYEYSFRLSTFLQTPPDLVPVLFRGLQLPDLDYNRHLLSPPYMELVDSINKIQKLNAGEFKIDKKSAKLIFEAKYLPEHV